MDELSKLAEKYGADKWGKHHYTPFYFDLFEFDRTHITKVIEIGAGEGASLRMWREFFPNAMIYGADNQDNRIFKETRIEVIKCDQSKREDLLNLIKTTGFDIDLFVDDGSHKPEDQIFTLATVMPMLKKGATYVIEDVAKPGFVDALDVLGFPNKYHLKEVKVGRRYDDRLVIVKHK